MIISIDTEKTFDEIQYSFMMKAVRKIRIKRNSLNLIKSIYKNLTASIIVDGKKLNAFPKIRNKAKMYVLTTFPRYSTGSSSQCNKSKKEIKGIQIREEEIKWSLTSEDMIFYVENPEDSRKTA